MFQALYLRYSIFRNCSHAGTLAYEHCQMNYPEVQYSIVNAQSVTKTSSNCKVLPLECISKIYMYYYQRCNTCAD